MCQVGCARVRSPVRGFIHCATPLGGSASVTTSPIVLYTISPPTRVFAAMAIVQFCAELGVGCAAARRLISQECTLPGRSRSLEFFHTQCTLSHHYYHYCCYYHHYNINSVMAYLRQQG
eukprot:COSAG02_NODE_18707_length_923_cov_17.393204_1_plen_119_part_00